MFRLWFVLPRPPPKKIWVTERVVIDIINRFSNKRVLCKQSTYPIFYKALLNLERRIAKQSISKAKELGPEIWGMCYNSACDELFFADYNNNAVCWLHLRNYTVEVRDVESGTEIVYNICYMSDSDTLLLCSWEQWQGTDGYWLVALVRNEIEWREAHRVPIEINGLPNMFCALSNSRVLVGSGPSRDMELFSVHDADPRIAHISRIHVPDKYRWFSATSSSGCSETLVALSHEDSQVVSVHRLVGDRLEELARIAFNEPVRLLWLNDRILLAQERGSETISELEFSGTQLVCRRLISACKVGAWCAAGNDLAVVDTSSGDLLYYPLK